MVYLPEVFRRFMYRSALSYPVVYEVNGIMKAPEVQQKQISDKKNSTSHRIKFYLHKIPTARHM